MTLDDKTLDKIIKAVVENTSAAAFMRLYASSQQGGNKRYQQARRAELRTIVRRLLPDPTIYRGRVTNLSDDGLVTAIEIEPDTDDDHFLRPGTPVIVEVDTERDLDELAAQISPKQWDALSVKGTRRNALTRALLKRRPKP